MDWMYDELFDGRRLWVLTIVDNFSRVSPGIWVGRQAKATDVVTALRAAVAEFGCPQPNDSWAAQRFIWHEGNWRWLDQ